MSDGVDSEGLGDPRGAEDDPAAVERRLRRDMCAATALSVAASLLVWPWRVTAGLLLGGALALFNFHWLASSVRAVFGALDEGTVPKLGAARYVLRYFVVAGLVFAAYWLDAVSLVAVLVGMCSFAAAALAEGFRQLYFSFVGREDS
jgi:hypothetical protein